MKNALIVSVALLSAVFCAADAGAQQIKVLPKDSWVMDITPDGETVVGSYDSNVHSSFIWRWRVDPAPTVIPGGDFVAVSDDGTVVTGNFSNGTLSDTSDDVAAIWTAATGWQSLGFLPGTPAGCGGGLSAAYDISGDGTAVVGLAWSTSCSGIGFRWTAATGMVPLQVLANGGNRCSTISGDGSVLAGFAQGTFARTPAYWKPDGSGSVLNPSFQGEVLGFTENGGLSVGTLYFSGDTFSAYVRNQQTGVITEIGKLHPNGWAAQAWDISEDGQTIVGLDHNLGARQAWIWTPTDGIVSMKDKLTALGLTGLPAEFWVARKCSDDGRVIVGGGLNPAGTFIAGFIAELAPSTSTTWSDLGHGLAGVSGIPTLEGTGSLAPGATTQLVLSNAKPNGVAAYFAGASQIDVPFKQGIMVPALDFVLTGLPLSPLGKVSIQFPWPAGLPSGFFTYHQMWVVDATSPAGFAASNGLVGITP